MIVELLTALKERDRRCEQVEHRLDELLRRLYGPRAEKLDANQLKLFAEAMAAAGESAESAAAPPPVEASTSPVRRNGHGRRRLPDNLPRREVVHDVAAADRLCPCCGKERHEIGREVSEQLDYEPASMFVTLHIRPKYACKGCQEHVIIADKPAQPIDKGLPGPGLLAQVIVSKYADHLPLNRLEGIFARQGVQISRSTMCGWMAACAALLNPLYCCMIQRVRSSKVIHTDDTPVPVLDESRDKTRQGRMWVYIGDAANPYVVFDYTPSRKRDGPANWLDGFKGYLQADAFGGYDGIYATGNVTEVACWAHARRKFYDARVSAPGPAHAAMAWIGRLYEVEGRAKELDAASRRLLRHEQSRPLLESLYAWLIEQRSAALPKSPIAQAIGYALGNWDALCRYTDDGDLNIDNNASERELRRIAVGRKNWMFAGSDNGGNTAAVLFTLTASARRHELDPWRYLRDVLARMPATPISQLEEFLPDRWKAGDQPAG
jgi:transposase